MSEEKTTGETAGGSAESTAPVSANTSTTPKADNSKVCAVLSYFLVGILWFFIDEELKKSEFAKFHVKQALILAIASIIGSIILTIIPILGWIILPFFYLLTTVLSIIGIINAVNGDKKELPIVGPYADKYLKF